MSHYINCPKCAIKTDAPVFCDSLDVDTLTCYVCGYYDGQDTDQLTAERDTLRARVAELEAVAKELMWQGDVAITGLSEFRQVRNLNALRLALTNAHTLLDTKDTRHD